MAAIHPHKLGPSTLKALGVKHHNSECIVRALGQFRIDTSSFMMSVEEMAEAFAVFGQVMGGADPTAALLRVRIRAIRTAAKRSNSD